MPSSGVRWFARLPLVLAALVLTACGSSSPPPDALSGKSPTQVLRLALADARKAGTVRYTITTQSGSAKQIVTGDANTTGGAVVVTNSTGTLRVVVIGDTGYIQSDAPALQGALGVSSAVADANANKWISVTSADSQFSELATATSFTSTLAEFTPGGNALHLTEKTVAGRRVGLINGVGKSSVAVQSYAIQLAVTTKRPVLPVAGAVTVQGNGKTATQIAVFAVWGKPLTLTAPANPIPLSAITKG
jgi:hypothetical protein